MLLHALPRIACEAKSKDIIESCLGQYRNMLRGALRPVGPGSVDHPPARAGASHSAEKRLQSSPRYRFMAPPAHVAQALSPIQDLEKSSWFRLDRNFPSASLYSRGDNRSLMHPNGFMPSSIGTWVLTSASSFAGGLDRT